MPFIRRSIKNLLMNLRNPHPQCLPSDQPTQNPLRPPTPSPPYPTPTVNETSPPTIPFHLAAFHLPPDPSSPHTRRTPSPQEWITPEARPQALTTALPCS